MPSLRIAPTRWTGIVENAVRSGNNNDAPSPHFLQDSQLQDGFAWSFRDGRPILAPAVFGTASRVGRARGFMLASGDGYEKPLFWGHDGEPWHYTAGDWADAGTIPAGAGSPNVYRGANGLGLTLVPFGGTAALQKYDGTVLSAVGGTAPTGLAMLAFFRLSQRFLGAKWGEDILRWCAINDQTAWTTGDGGSEKVGNDRLPITAIAEGPGDYSTVFKANYIYIIERTDPEAWALRRMASDKGAMGPRAWCHGPTGSIFFAHQSGIWIINGEGKVMAIPLTLALDKTWRLIFKTYATSGQYVSMAYDGIREELFVLVPQAAGTLGHQIWRCYIPDASWCVDSSIVPGGDTYAALALLKDANGAQHPFYAQETIAGATTAYQMNAGALAPTGAYIRTKLFGKATSIMEWGVDPERGQSGRILYAFLKNRGSGSVKITPTIWRTDGTNVSLSTTVSLGGTAGTPLIAEIPVPNEGGPFIDVKVENVSTAIADFEGFEIPYEVR